MRTLLRENEKILLIVHKHWIILVKPFLILSLSLGFFVGVVLKGYNPTVAIIVCVICLLYAIYCWFERKYNIWAVTDLRVIDEWGVFTLNSKETPLQSVQNVHYKQSIMGRIMDYGEVDIQTAALEGKTTNDFVSSPKLLKRTIVEAQERLMESSLHSPVHRRGNEEKGDHGDRIECPFCAELIKPNARICRFCGKELVDDNTRNQD